MIENLLCLSQFASYQMIHTTAESLHKKDNNHASRH